MFKNRLWISLIGVIHMTVPLLVKVSASTGMGGDPPGTGKDNPQPDRVGNQDEDHPSDHADSVGGAFSDEECAED
jgi:hypothetical protein